MCTLSLGQQKTLVLLDSPNQFVMSCTAALYNTIDWQLRHRLWVGKKVLNLMSAFAISCLMHGSSVFVRVVEVSLSSRMMSFVACLFL